MRCDAKQREREREREKVTCECDESMMRACVDEYSINNSLFRGRREVISIIIMGPRFNHVVERLIKMTELRYTFKS